MYVLDLDKLIPGEHVRVAAIGSCRIHNPLKTLVKANKARHVWNAINPFTHSLPEALQQLRFLNGHLDLPSSYAPFIFEKEDVPDRGVGLPELIDSIDIFMVEISDYRVLRCDEFCFEQVYFSNLFVRPGGLPMLDWWRAVMKDDAQRRAAAIEAILKERRGGGTPVSSSEETVLRSARFLGLSQSEFDLALDELMKSSKKRWIFVPHFDVPDQAGRPFPTRVSARAMLFDAQRRFGFETIDPTPLLLSAGLSVSLKGGGADRGHYDPAFEALVGEMFAARLVK